MTLQLGRGVNIEGWLSHQDRPLEQRPLSFEREDAERVAAAGLEHLRINVNEKSLWDDDGRENRENFDRVDALLEDCARLGLKAVFDLHVIRSHFFNAKVRPLFEDDACIEEFLETWRKLSAHLRGWPNDLLAYEFLNEPVADDSEDWNRVVAAIHPMLRELEPERTLVLGSNAYSSPGTFPRLTVPEDDHMILTFHFYLPFALTHYRVFRREGMYEGPVHYPGQVIADEDLATMSEEMREKSLRDNGPYDREVIREKFRPAIDVAAAHGMPLYCGEWGCYDTVPRPTRLRWLSDMVRVLAEENICWAAYAYRNRWSTFLDKNRQPDEETVQILLGNHTPG